MRTLISDVLLPASAAVGLLAMLIIDPVMAQDQPLPQQAAATMAAVSTPVASARHSAPSRAEASRPDEMRKAGIETRCERTERIGKFAITRCQ